MTDTQAIIGACVACALIAGFLGLTWGQFPVLSYAGFMVSVVAFLAFMHHFIVGGRR